MEAGSVQGVVVQMIVETFFPGQRRDQIFAGSSEQPVLHPHRAAGVVLVLDFGFSQRGLVVHAPIHRAQAFVDESILVERKKLSKARPTRIAESWWRKADQIARRPRCA